MKCGLDNGELNTKPFSLVGFNLLSRRVAFLKFLILSLFRRLNFYIPKLIWIHKIELLPCSTRSPVCGRGAGYLLEGTLVPLSSQGPRAGLWTGPVTGLGGTSLGRTLDRNSDRTVRYPLGRTWDRTGGGMGYRPPKGLETRSWVPHQPPEKTREHRVPPPPQLNIQNENITFPMLRVITRSSLFDPLLYSLQQHLWAETPSKSVPDRMPHWPLAA